ncbi:hypothetical protein J4E91_006663 [Alternaria rosae]|nr:hypothetical protein J4E91_006663 [Alternaria rosae]
MSAPWSEPAPRRKANYKVRFRHGVYPDLESQATRADIKKYDYFFGAAQRWVGTPGTLDFVDESSLVAEEFEGPGTWPIPDPIEAIFKNIVPKLALTSPMLMNAILMISGQCILRFDRYFPTRPYDYHERLLQSLIPYIAEKGQIEDEATLVAAMLLRNFEDFHAGTQGQSHLSTFELFYGPEGWVFDMSSPVVQAALALHVHTEVSQALLNQPSLRIDYENFILPALVSPVDEVSWSNRILWLSARILQWAQRGVRTMAEWQYLRSLVDEWERRRPASFDAFFYQEEEVQATGMPTRTSVEHLKEHWNWRWNHNAGEMN